MELDECITVPRIDGVKIKKGSRQYEFGTFVMTRHHFIFSPEQTGGSSSEFWLLHRAIERVFCEPNAREGIIQGGLLTMKCKNFMTIIVEIPSFEDAKATASAIDQLSNIAHVTLEYPCFFRCPFKVLDNGWEAFSVENEFARLLTSMGTDCFRISSVNSDFSVCPTYPAKVIVPKGIGDDYLKISATFRDGGRFPVLSYYHKSTKSTILRCGQPLIGPTNRRCKEDETILNSLLTINRGVIVDTRAKAVAQGAKSKGGGHESPVGYSRWRYMNFGTPRLKEMRQALGRMAEVCADGTLSSDRLISKLNSAGWLAAVSDHLNCAANVAQCVHCEGTPEVPVIVHGGEGVDSTLVVTSIAQVLLDPDSRTIRGFEALVEREWMLGGHPFSSRNSHLAYAEKQQEGPVFLCFLDCVYQVLQQFPNSFEFGENFLIDLFEHSYASEFGTFLGDNDAHRLLSNLKELSVSLWSYINNPEVLKTYVNDLYDPRSHVIWPSVAPQTIKVWDRLFFRWVRDWTEEDAIKRTAQQWKAKEKTLMRKALLLRKQLIDLSKEASLQAGTAQMSIT